MITHVIVKLDLPIEGKYWEDDDVFSKEYYGIGKPLIQCKDCKHNKNNGWVDCPITEYFGRTLDNYCSLAEKEEE